MIIGLEYLILGLFIGGLVLLFVAVILGSFKMYKTSGMLTGITVAAVLISISLYAATMSAQDNIEEHYVDYLKLQVQVARYEDLDVLEQYGVYDDVMTYNLWYERNKSDLENEWSFKGTSAYAKEFDYIVIGG